MVANHTYSPYHDLLLQAKAYDMAGRDSLVFQWFIQVSPASIQKINSVKESVDKLFSAQGGFLSLRLINTSRKILSENFYWLPDSTGNYTGLQKILKADVKIEARKASEGRIEVKIENTAGNPVAFFNRISLVDSKRKKRILPVFYSDNYISVLPGEEKSVFIDFTPDANNADIMVSVNGWNVDERYVEIK